MWQRNEPPRRAQSQLQIERILSKGFSFLKTVPGHPSGFGSAFAVHVVGHQHHTASHTLAPLTQWSCSGVFSMVGFPLPPPR